LVKFLFSALLLIASLQAEQSILERVSALMEPKDLKTHKNLIDIVFKDQSKFLRNGRLDSVKVASTLKENGLLNLFFGKPTKIYLDFETGGNALFFTKLINDALRSLGYYRYLNLKASSSEQSFERSIMINSEYAPDPVLFSKILEKIGCTIVNISRANKAHWKYEIDISNAKLNVPSINGSEKLKLRQSRDDYWLRLNNIKKIRLQSIQGNNWYPYVTFYDKNLHLLHIYKKDERTKKITFALPKDTVYIKISDIYQLANLRKGLNVVTQGKNN